MPEENIPKIIHYCWFGSNEKPEIVEKCIKSWKKYLPEYKIIEWNNDNLKDISNAYVKEAFIAKKYAFVSDYFRLYALYHHGGIYFDTDNQIFKSFDKFLTLDFFSGYENWNNIISPFTAVVGAKKGNHIIKDLLDEYNDIHFILPDGKLDTTTNTSRVTNYFQRKYNFVAPYDENKEKVLEKGCIIFPSNIFCKYERNISHAIHLFNASWVYEYKERLNFIQKIFSVTEEIKNGINRKIITILGLKFKLKNKQLIQSDKKLLFVHRKNTQNIGDKCCSPYLYFKFNMPFESLDILEFNNKKIKDKILIVGGGGLLQKYFKKSINNIIKLAKHNKVIFWGIGYDNLPNHKRFYNANIKNCNIIGCRDFKSKYVYVPDVSCMSELFDKYRNNECQDKIRVYLHHCFMDIPQLLKKYPTMNNDNESMQDVIEFLSGGEVILTNSFHGCYWATLLNKKVVCFPWEYKNRTAFSEKFKNMEYMPILCKDINMLESCINNAKNYPNALTNCRKINIEFFKKVAELLKD